MRRVLAALCLAATATAAAAEPIAVLQSNNGTVAPPFRVDVTVTVEADLLVTITECKAYDETNCRSFEGRTTAAALAAIETAARSAGCIASPLQEEPNPPVGGGFLWGVVQIDGVRCALPAFAAAADEPRKSAIVAAINLAVPSQMAPAGDPPPE
jgi:hypothetical protein